MSWINRAAVLASVASSAYLGGTAALALNISRRQRRVPIHDDPSSIGLPYKNVSFTSRRDFDDPERKLKGWIVFQERSGYPLPVSETRWIVLVHGDGSNRTDPQAGAMGLAKAMWDAGYGVLMFDLRGCGESDNGDFTGGWHERLDVLGALDYLVFSGADRSRIGVLGFSLGAVAAALACANPGVAAALITDSAYCDFWSIMKERSRLQPWAAGLFRPGVDLMLQMLVGYRLGEVSPERHVSECDVPILFIHGERDDVVPLDHAKRLARARGISQTDIDSTDSENFWIVPDAGHTQAFRVDSAKYVSRVSEFLDRHLAS